MNFEKDNDWKTWFGNDNIHNEAHSNFFKAEFICSIDIYISSLSSSTKIVEWE